MQRGSGAVKWCGAVVRWSYVVVGAVHVMVQLNDVVACCSGGVQ